MANQTTTTSSSAPPNLPARGTITSWQPEDSIGRIQLSSGEEIRFGHSACVGLRPSVGVEVWVVEVAPHPLGGLRAKVLNSTGAATPDRATAALTTHQEREKLRPAIEAEVTAIKEECAATLAAKPAPWTVAAAAGIDGIADIEQLRGRMPHDEVAAFVSTIPAVHVDRDGKPSDALRLYDLEWSDSWRHFEVWMDPCFLPFAAEGGNHLGLFAHPLAMEQGLEAPVLFRFHEHDPIFAWVAESAEHFVRMIDAASRGDDVDALRGERHESIMALVEASQRIEASDAVDRADVNALFWGGSRVLEQAAAERLETLYRERGWTFPQASIEAQRALSIWQDRIDAAWAKLP